VDSDAIHEQEEQETYVTSNHVTTGEESHAFSHEKNGEEVEEEREEAPSMGVVNCNDHDDDDDDGQVPAVTGNLDGPSDSVSKQQADSTNDQNAFTSSLDVSHQHVNNNEGTDLTLTHSVEEAVENEAPSDPDPDTDNIHDTSPVDETNGNSNNLESNDPTDDTAEDVREVTQQQVTVETSTLKSTSQTMIEEEQQQEEQEQQQELVPSGGSSLPPGVPMGVPMALPRNPPLDTSDNPNPGSGQKQTVSSTASARATMPAVATQMVSSTAILTEKENIPVQYVGRIIGKGGEQIRDLQARSACKVDVDQNVPHGAPRVITYQGTRDKIDFAKSLVAMLCKDNWKTVELPLGFASRAHLQVTS
jgi:far upstream element-binding protein